MLWPLQPQVAVPVEDAVELFTSERLKGRAKKPKLRQGPAKTDVPHAIARPPLVLLEVS